MCILVLSALPVLGCAGRPAGPAEVVPGHRAPASRCAGCPLAEQGSSAPGLGVAAGGASRSARGVFRGQGSNLCLLRWRVDFVGFFFFSFCPLSTREALYVTFQA